MCVPYNLVYKHNYNSSPSFCSLSLTPSLTPFLPPLSPDAQGFLIDSEVFTVHDVAGALKNFFKTLPDPLLTHQLYDTFITIMSKTLTREEEGRKGGREGGRGAV